MDDDGQPLALGGRGRRLAETEFEIMRKQASGQPQQQDHLHDRNARGSPVTRKQTTALRNDSPGHA
jgi:hypothetical protein